MVRFGRTLAVAEGRQDHREAGERLPLHVHAVHARILPRDAKHGIVLLRRDKRPA